jgi:hypothetical protein
MGGMLDSIKFAPLWTFIIFDMSGSKITITYKGDDDDEIV